MKKYLFYFILGGLAVLTFIIAFIGNIIAGYNILDFFVSDCAKLIYLSLGILSFAALSFFVYEKVHKL